jgi:Myosin head (motor domain)
MKHEQKFNSRFSPKQERKTKKKFIHFLRRMTERTIVWVDESLLLNDSKRRNTNAIQSHTPSKPVKYGSSGKRVQMTDTIDTNNKSYKWVRCYLLGGHITDTELSVEVSLATEEWKVGQKMTIVRPQPGTVLMGNSDLIEPPNDLITLPHLNEPSVVFALQSRYESNTIYTSTGPILLALNPFQSVPSLYDETTRLHYWRHGEGLVDGDLEPHVYANADCAFRQMLRGIGSSVMYAATTNPFTSSSSSSSTSIDQSILVSGESGAGKTVTTKHIMSYLAMLSERKTQHDSEQQREHPRRAPSPGRRNEGLSLLQSPPSLLTRRMSSRRFGWNAGAHIEQKSKNQQTSRSS